VYGQPDTGRVSSETDTTSASPWFTVDDAWKYVHRVTTNDSLWSKEGDSVQAALIRLLNHAKEPFDSVMVELSRFDFQSIPVYRDKTPIRDSIEVRWLNDSTFIIDTVGWNIDLFMIQADQPDVPLDFSALIFSDTTLMDSKLQDTTLTVPDTIGATHIDTAALKSLQIPMYSYLDRQIIPPVVSRDHYSHLEVLHHPGVLVYTDTVYRWKAADDSPFLFVTGEEQLDSLQVAMETLMAYSEQKDSIRLIINDMYGKKTPMWITTGDNDLLRFWVKNYKNDSITLWLGNPSNHEISLLLEDDIDVNRMERVEMAHLPKSLSEPERTLAKMDLLQPDPFYWTYDFSSAFTFNQTYLSNWIKGGESSLTTMLDLIGSATYNNKEDNTQWINSARIKFGTLMTEEKGLRKNNDLFEINSKFNRNASGKIGLSASFYMKNQVAKGYNYPNDSVVVSKFLNPASLTIGLGAEYKPFKNTTINMAPLSYKNTFVLDTVLVDQTQHGIDKDKRSKQELGTQVVFINKITPMEDLNITNKLRLFSNYLNHPQNVDIDWELLVDKKINWFFTIRFNLHLIYDDDIRFPLFDSNEQPVLLNDGTQKKVARTQLKEFVGLSLLFKF